jgi:putative ABC transport system permease protein
MWFVGSTRSSRCSTFSRSSASTRDIIAIVLREALVLAGAGIVAGSIAAVWATRFVAAMLFQVSATDPLAFAIGGVVILVVALGASVLPARRAARVDPMQALASN